jgi:pyruvate kinase
MQALCEIDVGTRNEASDMAKAVRQTNDIIGRLRKSAEAEK